MPLRLSKIVMVAALALLISLVALGNITDYGTNFSFVRHVLAMDTIFPDSGIHYRAIASPLLQHSAYVLIIAVQVITAALCWVGMWRMWRRRHAPAALFQRSKGLAVMGLSSGVALWLVGFMAIGGEWFGMWMSSQWNGIETSFRLVALLLGALIYLGQREAEPE
ncbi:Predicted small integral membrane protein [Dyella sp. OK004]|nr:Predicted small integral membrane protein [Dyella sp. OK004]